MAVRLEMDDLRKILLHFALMVGLPVDAVKKIRNEFFSWAYERLTLIGNRRLTHNPYPYPYQQKGWSGTNRMRNRSQILNRYNVWWDNLILGRWSGGKWLGEWIHDR